MTKTMKAQTKGRKKLPAENVKEPVTIFVPKFVIDQFGTKQTLKENLHCYIANEIKTKTNGYNYHLNHYVID